MRVFFADTVPLPLPPGHRFPADKYARLKERVRQSNLFTAQELIPATPASDSDLLRVHHPEYVVKIVNGTLSEREQRRIGFPWSEAMVDRSRRSVGATLEASRASLEDGLSANLAGGTHHAYADHGEGYCVFNDVAVAARGMLAERRARRIAIIDCDVHQGNGTAAIFAGDPAVFTFSVHGEKNFPFHKEASSLDIPLQDRAGDDAYLEAIERGVKSAMLSQAPDLVYYLAGADPFEDDTLGRLAISKAGLQARDRLVLSFFQSTGIPLVITMAGGYARKIDDTVDIHFTTLCIAKGMAKGTHHPE